MLQEATATDRQARYLPHIDGLRAIAIALVIAHHAWPQWLPGGYVGVDVFFVISGYIITRGIYAEISHGEFSFLTFLSRRARRLIPAAIVCFFLTSIGAAVILAPEALVDYSHSLLSAFAMLSNVFFYSTSGYFSPAAIEKPLLHTWSLAVEDQFYLTWPLLLLMLRRILSPSRILWAVLALAAVSLVHAEFSVGRDPDYAFYWLIPRAFELLLGCALAIAAIQPPDARYGNVAAALGLAAIFASVWILTPHSPVPGLALLPVCLGTAACIWGASSCATAGIGAVLSSAPIVFLGKISYSLYLYHWPLLSLSTHILGRSPDAIEATALVAVSILAAVASWSLVEQKMTSTLRLRSSSPRHILGVTCAMAALVAAAGWSLSLDHGWKRRLNDTAQSVYAAAGTANPWHEACDGERMVFANNVSCTLGKPRPDGKFDFAIIGDSNADHFVPMLHALASAQGAAGRQVTRSTCGPIVGLYRTRERRLDKEEICAAFQADVIKFIDNNPSLKTVILSAAWQDYEMIPASLNETGQSLKMEIRANETAIDFFLDSTVRLLRERGIRVIIIGQVPWLEPYSLGCFALAAQTGDRANCATKRSQAVRSIQESQQKFSQAAAADPQLQFIDMVDALCTSDLCSGFKENVFLYRNYNHLNAVGSAYLANFIDIALAPRSPPSAGHPVN